MKLAVCSQGTDLDANVDSRFGRSPYFVIVDLDNDEFESIENPSVTAAHGAGIATVQVLAKKGVGAVCSQNVGPNAIAALRSAGIPVYSMASGKTVREVVESFKNGSLGEHSRANVKGHH